MENCDDAYGFPPYPVIQDFLHSRHGADLRGVERRTTAAALAGIPSLATEVVHDGLVAAATEIGR